MKPFQPDLFATGTDTKAGAQADSGSAAAEPALQKIRKSLSAVQRRYDDWLLNKFPAATGLSPGIRANLLGKRRAEIDGLMSDPVLRRALQEPLALMKEEPEADSENAVQKALETLLSALVLYADGVPLAVLRETLFSDGADFDDERLFNELYRVGEALCQPTADMLARRAEHRAVLITDVTTFMTAPQTPDTEGTHVALVTVCTPAREGDRIVLLRLETEEENFVTATMSAFHPEVWSCNIGQITAEVARKLGFAVYARPESIRAWLESMVWLAARSMLRKDGALRKGADAQVLIRQQDYESVLDSLNIIEARETGELMPKTAESTGAWLKRVKKERERYAAHQLEKVFDLIEGYAAAKPGKSERLKLERGGKDLAADCAAFILQNREAFSLFLKDPRIPVTDDALPVTVRVFATSESADKTHESADTLRLRTWVRTVIETARANGHGDVVQVLAASARETMARCRSLRTEFLMADQL